MAARAGLKAVELFEAIDAGRVRAVWIMATNPVVSLPDADVVRRALQRCPLVIVSDCVAANDTLPFAHIRLPAAGWGEKEGTVTNSDRHVSRQRAFLAPPGRRGRTGGSSARWRSAWASRRASISPAPPRSSMSTRGSPRWRGASTCCLDLTGLAGMDARGYEQLAPTQWPVPARGRPRVPSPMGASHRRMAARASSPRAPRGPRHAPTAEYPLVAEHRPHPRPVAHHDAHRARAAAQCARARTLRRRAPAGSAPPSACAGRTGARDVALGQCAGARAQQRRAARRHGVHAHPLERAVRAAARASTRWSIRWWMRCRVSRSSSTRRCGWNRWRWNGRASCCRVAAWRRRDALWWALSPGAERAAAGVRGSRRRRARMRHGCAACCRMRRGADWIEFEDAGAGSYRAALLEDDAARAPA